MAYNDDYDTQEERRQARTQSVNYAGYTNPAPPQPYTAPASPQASAPQPAQPTGTYDRNQFRDAWMGSGIHDTAGLANFVQQHQGDYGAGVQVLPGGKGDKIRLPDGSLIDAVIGAGVGGTGAGWTGDPSQMGGSPGGAPNAGAGAAGSGSLPLGATDPTVQALLKTLQARADQSLNINSATDPNIRAQADPYAAAQERMRRQYLAQQAEKQGPNANLTNEERLTAEQTGQASGQYEASLVGNEIQARRQEIHDALSSMQSMLTDQQKMALQKELAQLDDATKRYGIASQSSIANRGLDNDWANSLMRNDQFNARLGLDAEDQYNKWKQAFGG